MNNPKIKKLLLRLGLAVAIVIISGLVAAYFCANSIVKRNIEAEGSQMTATAVRLGAAEVEPFSGTGSLADLIVENPPGCKAALAMTVKRISFAVKMSTVLSKPQVIEEFRMESPEFHVEGTLFANNLTEILANLMKHHSRRKFIVRDLLITGAVVRFNLTGSLGSGIPPTVTLPPLHLKDLGVAANGESPSKIAAEVAIPFMASMVEIALKSSATQTAGKTNAANGSSLLGNAVRSLGGLFGR